MRQMSTFLNHNEEYFYILKNEHIQRTFILPPPLIAFMKRLEFLSKEEDKDAEIVFHKMHLERANIMNGHLRIAQEKIKMLDKINSH